MDINAGKPSTLFNWKMGAWEFHGPVQLAPRLMIGLLINNCYINVVLVATFNKSLHL